jgi:hypothetical protein
LLAARFFVLVVESRELLQVFRFEHGVAVETAHVVDTIPPHQELRALMITARHKKQTIILILMKVGVKSRPRKREKRFEGPGAAALGRPHSG